MAKDKKKQDKKDKKDKKHSKAPKRAPSGLQALTQNPLVADVVAAALVSMAAALKDSKAAHRLAGEAGDELKALTKAGAKQGSAMWDLALDIGRRTLDAISEQSTATKSRGK